MIPDKWFSLAYRISALLLLALSCLSLTGCGNGGTESTVYKRNCANCHGQDGAGLRNLFPPLAGSDYLDERLSLLPCLLANGVKGLPKAGDLSEGSRMPTFAHLPMEELTDLIAYLHNEWGSGSQLVSEQAVRKWLRNCP